MPPADSHADHDQLAIAAYAAGDATGRDLETATALTASCVECAALHHDLRAIAAAMPLLPAPVRTRDFRLTAAQADALHPAGWRRLLAPFAGPRFSFAGPLGTGLATLGLAGILVAGGGIPLGGATSADTTAGGANTTLEAPATAQGTDAEDRSMAVMVAPEPTAVPASDLNAGAAPSTPVGAAGAAGGREAAPAATAGPVAATGVAAPASEAPAAVTAPEGSSIDPAASGKMADAADTFGPRLRHCPLPPCWRSLTGLALLILRLAARRLA